MSDADDTLCARCSAEVPQDERVACAACLAVHHPACWGELNKCVKCGETTPLRDEAHLTRPGPYGWHHEAESDVRGTFVSAGASIVLVLACLVFSLIVFLLKANW